MRTDEALALLDVYLARATVHVNGKGIDPSLPVPIDWAALFKRELDSTWLVENLWPAGRQVHLHAARKTGKSLVSLWIACNLASGRDPFTGSPIEPVAIAYLDFEMTEDDLLERVEEMGFTAEQLIGRLHYFLHPMLPMLDTKEGGTRLLEVLKAYEVRAVIIDTLSRVVAGEESSNDTYIRFFKWSGILLKSAGIALLRLDHEGHESGRSRGASSKADDVDVVWQLAISDDGLTFNRKASRISWVPEVMHVRKREEPTLAFSEIRQAWPMGTKAKAEELDQLGAASNISRREASRMLKDAGLSVGRTTVLNAALRYRTQRLNWGLK